MKALARTDAVNDEDYSKEVRELTKAVNKRPALLESAAELISLGSLNNKKFVKDVFFSLQSLHLHEDSELARATAFHCRTINTEPGNNSAHAPGRRNTVQVNNLHPEEKPSLQTNVDKARQQYEAQLAKSEKAMKSHEDKGRKGLWDSFKELDKTMAAKKRLEDAENAARKNE
jgi:hypothetical protein